MKPQPVVINMKNLRLVIGIVVIIALVSPAFALDMADFRATDWRQSHSSFPEPKIGHPYDWRSTPLPEMKSKLPTIVVPTPTPTPDENDCYRPCRVALLRVTSTPTRAFVYIDGSLKGFTPITICELSVGTHQCLVRRLGYEDYSTEIVIPEPAWHCACQSCLAGDWTRGICKLSDDIPIDVTLKKVESFMPKTPYPSPF